ncbi:055b94c4-2d8d-4f50-8988-59c70801379f [Thermothielavioides terrestris]|uniref:055b94c4-2d8d-4f50-8988-59c70801379f n=1 Tax=Thermothielavioides terrestris TaxID=2587410 RepID=A0A446BED2_9PEZI|nr:055b94c4-2d8d-4f50-8988-59c70801379f [Thermothielavioides terrestris]
MTTTLVRRTTKILVLNPNSSQAMTLGLREAIRDLELSKSTEVYTYTAPSSSPASINDGHDLLASTESVCQDLTKTGLLGHYDAVLVACFSAHPLVGILAERDGEFGPLAVTGIFEASILTCLSLLPPGKKWGIVTTGRFWEDHLTQGVNVFLGTQQHASNIKFAGVETTGLNAGDFHGGVEPAVVREKLREATRRLLDKGDVECVVMGCAGMAGLEEIIRSVAVEQYGSARGDQILVIDGVRAGIGLLEQMVRNRRAFSRAS